MVLGNLIGNWSHVVSSHVNISHRFVYAFMPQLWHPIIERKWLHRFDCLVTFIQREGHMGVPKDHIEGSLALGAWIDEQLEAYAEGTIPEFHRVKLEEIPLWRWPSKRKIKTKKRKR